MSSYSRIKKLYLGLLNLFLKSNCPLCQRPTSVELCEQCYRQLQKCHLPNPNFLWKKPLPIFGWGSYSSILRRAVAAMKYENQPEIARPLGQWLGEAWLLNLPLNLLECTQPIVVVPIPLHPDKQKERGYNQAALIAQSFCHTTGLQLKLNGLERIRETQAQYRLSASEREKNLARAFTLGKDFRDRHSNYQVLLLDDIYTTGATAKSATETLRQAKIETLGLAAVAVAQKDKKNL
ncbi:ComF family protein [Aetokthonos hydrillicola Thurmond2011]|jgi:ComF family protein|uniref:ComF family protein n=1 Tax=Aetokthonos hydrillicola Thurmond2011 TaxID=2712845 RepID=A0AAP5MBA4_9CYAN|nr:ComF family protein [Aetokthonos hydrillicola]MBO3463783.1 ComF family protein [Aetokthonos hydrillicola CCALA 1050]MBW4585266.1 ComF family protein [Aetokthonos hydrillicola CCALA 1050]MDR9896599.1 ComF family protein [Aetokthonos hydrillicola Thurmond2011]